MNRADIRGRIRRLDEPAKKFTIEAVYVAQHRTALKPDETTAYASALV